MNGKKTGKLILLLTLSALLLCGFSFRPGSVTLSVTENPLYVYTAVDEMVKDAGGNYSALDRKYNGKAVYTAGLVKEISGDGKKITLCGISEGSASRLPVTITDPEAAKKAAAFHEGDFVLVYGKGVTFPVGTKLSLHAYAVTQGEKGGSYEGTRAFPGGKAFHDRLARNRSLSRKKALYRMPDSWTGCEKELDSAYIEGFQYSLNEISGDFRAEPEKLFIFYLDYEKNLQNITDRDDVKGVERAVIENILKNENVSGFPKKTLKTDTGIPYAYYDTSYVDSQRRFHNVEFLFTPVHDEGILCVLYVFSTSDHKEDILYLLNSVEIP